MGDLKESGELEHDADIIWLLTREPGASLCKIILSKNRDGRVGSHYIRFAGDVLTFDENMEKITA
jgi:replicative DNA helicase